jgi:phospholipase C
MKNWKIYYHDIALSHALSKLWLLADHFRYYEEFREDARSGRLPCYSFIEPRYFTILHPPNDQHPPHVVTLGEQLIADVYNCLRCGPAWPQTLLVILYDEHGGCYDHVPPPAATPPTSAPTAPFNFDRYGVGVPAVIVSPYIEQGTVLRASGNVPYDHTSIAATSAQAVSGDRSALDRPGSRGTRSRCCPDAPCARQSGPADARGFALCSNPR